MFNQFYFIYSIRNTKNNKRYIGYTNDLNRRLFDHWTNLQLKQHPNPKLQEDFVEADFKIEVLETFINISNEEIGQKEKEYIALYDSYNNGYNRTPGGEGQGARKFGEDDILKAAFILHHYENSSPLVQKIFNMSESATLRLKNKQTYIHIHQIIKNMDESTIGLFRQNLESQYNLTQELENHKNTITYGTRALDRETVLQIIAVCNNRDKKGATIERKLGLAAQATSRIKRGLRYKEYYNEYQNMTGEEQLEWLNKGLKSFEID